MYNYIPIDFIVNGLGVFFFFYVTNNLVRTYLVFATNNIEGLTEATREVHIFKKPNKSMPIQVNKMFSYLY